MKQWRVFCLAMSLICMMIAVGSVLAERNVFIKRASAAANYEQLREQNNKKLADSPKMIYTTRQAVGFAFAGLTKPEVVYKTLAWLKKNNAKGTFFIMENEMRSNPDMVRDIISSGNEAAIGLRSLRNADYYTACRQITNMKNVLARYGVYTNLVMQPWGQITDDMREAVSAMGCQMVSPTMNMVSSRHQSYTSADAVMNEQFGRSVYSVGRGWIICFRLDFYDDDNLVLNVMDLVKRHKVDNIAYNSFYDDPHINDANDSSYRIEPIGTILADKSNLYDFQGKREEDYSLDGRAYLSPHKVSSYEDFIYSRYIGNEAVEDSNVFGFSVEEKQYMDISGKIRTDKPVVFFTFDDWGSDAAINHLLYVFRKHNAKATFFILTHNVLNNPNLLRSIAKEGHDLASHSEFHHPMDGMNYEEAYKNYLIDYGIANAKLENIAGNVRHADGTSAVKPYFRPPTLTVSRAGMTALYDTGCQYVVSGSYSTHDYNQPDLDSMVNVIKEGLFDKDGKVQNGAILVMHMSDTSALTANALDMLLTINENRPDGDPAKFVPLPLSAYLSYGYNQSNYAGAKKNDSQSTNASQRGDSILYENSGYGVR